MGLRDSASASSQFFEYTHGWLVEMRSAPAVSTKTAGISAKLTSVTLFSPSTTSVRFLTLSSAAGDHYALNYLVAANARL